MVGSASSSSHPKYSDMIIEAIQANKADGNMNTSRQAILKFITSKYGIENQLATTSIKKNLKTMLESEVIKHAAQDGKKGAGSFRLGPKYKTPTKSAKAADGGEKTKKK